MQDSKEIIKNVENKKEEKRKEIKNFKKWIKTNYKKIILWSAVITALLLSIMSYYKTYNYKSYLGHDYTVYWGGLEQQYGHMKQMMNIKYVYILVLNKFLIMT
ncbi:hypothetical protein [Spiroplasma endosymbiont of Dactylopius coccus]